MSHALAQIEKCLKPLDCQIYYFSNICNGRLTKKLQFAKYVSITRDPNKPQMSSFLLCMYLNPVFIFTKNDLPSFYRTRVITVLVVIFGPKRMLTYVI